jgi:hypothetical protein
VNVVVEVLSILSIATKEMEQSLTSSYSLNDSTLDPSHIFSEKYLKKLVGRTDIEDGLKKLDNLIQGEHGMATAQVLKVANEIKGGV